MKSVRFAFLFAVFIAATFGYARADAAKPIRHLEYDVSVSLTGSLSQQGYAGTSSSNGGGNGDRGRMLIDVIAVQPDSGLVVKIVESTRGSRSAEPVLCVTYATGQVICESGKKVNEEEYTLLRLLGKNFVNPSAMDSKHHWRFETSSADLSETNDYTVAGEKDGIATISVERMLKVHGPQGYDASTSGKVTYNQALQVPIDVVEETETRAQTGDSYNRVDQTITLNLAVDSMQEHHS